jgi:hypothetical protein
LLPSTFRQAHGNRNAGHVNRHVCEISLIIEMNIDINVFEHSIAVDYLNIIGPEPLSLADEEIRPFGLYVMQEVGAVFSNEIIFNDIPLIEARIGEIPSSYFSNEENILDPLHLFLGDHPRVFIRK